MKKGISTILTVGLTVVVMAALATGGYYYINKQQQDEKVSLQAQVATLDKDLTTAKKGSAESTSTTATTNSTSSTAASTSSSSSVVATNIFTHKELGFSFTLPAGYIAVDNYNCEGGCGSSIVIANSVSSVSFNDTYVKLTYNKTGDTIDQMVKNDEIGSDNLGETNITIDGTNGKKISIGGFASGYYYYATKNGYNLEIKQYPSSDTNQKVVDSIVSTFQFTK